VPLASSFALPVVAVLRCVVITSVLVTFVLKVYNVRVDSCIDLLFVVSCSRFTQSIALYHVVVLSAQIN